jgi:tetratricopeptide (TPR) repeat protein
MFLRFKIPFLFLFLFQFLEAASSESLFVLEKNNQQLAEQAIDRTMSQDYDAAIELIKKMETKNLGVSCVFESIILISRFDDLGDTLDLIQSHNKLSECKTEGSWDAIRNYQLGFVKSQMGHSIKGALTTRDAAGYFKKSKDLNAMAFYSIYGYYLDNSFSFLPFVSDERENYLKTLEEASIKSNLFWPLFSTSLIWIYYDRGEFKKALEVAERVLKEYPKNDVFLQIKADMLYKLKRYDEAILIYLKSANEYAKKTGYSIRYWCAVANLIKIYHEKGDLIQSDLWRKKLSNDSFKKLKKWIPSSVLNDL